MEQYNYPFEDLEFLLSDVFLFDEQMSEMSKFSEVDLELILGIVKEYEKFCVEVLLPLNQNGDAEGCKFVDGQVKTPDGFPKAYRQFVENGWPSLMGEVEYGGQGLSHTVQFLAEEIISATNMSFGLFTGLTRGACEAIGSHASEELKARYLSKMISGEWTGVMALTEAGAGSDLGLLKTKAIPNEDGSYRIKGGKIFISSGDQDFGGNIIHLVLARLPDAPNGTRGISLFLVPKFLVGPDGEVGERNAINVGGIEHKMGIHAQPTCVMNYEEATGWLIGEPHQGLKAMFTMMNSERLGVGTQALGVAEAAYQQAKNYASERLQGRSSANASGPEAIINHPDVQRMLLTISSINQASRALGLWTSLQIDRQNHHPCQTTRQKSFNNVSLLTPIIKAALSDFGFESAVLAQQIFGGHGYIQEWGMEQFVRDVRITQIYEGTNGIQSLDLISRKILLDGGRLPFDLFDEIQSDLHEAGKHKDLDDISHAVKEALLSLMEITTYVQNKRNDPYELNAIACDYLRFFSLVIFGWMWVKMMTAAARRSEVDDGFYREKQMNARFFTGRILPQYLSLEASIKSGSKSMRQLSN